MSSGFFIIVFFHINVVIIMNLLSDLFIIYIIFFYIIFFFIENMGKTNKCRKPAILHSKPKEIISFLIDHYVLNRSDDCPVDKYRRFEIPTVSIANIDNVYL